VNALSAMVQHDICDGCIFAFPVPKKLLVHNCAFYKFPTAVTFQLITKREKMLTLTVEKNNIKLKQESPNFTKFSKISLKM